MTADIWLAFAATAIFLALLPSPLACLTASFSLQRGRRTAIATVPGLAAGMSAALIVAMVPMALVAVYLPKLIEVISWAGLGYIMLYVLWSYQDPRSPARSPTTTIFPNVGRRDLRMPVRQIRLPGALRRRPCSRACPVRRSRPVAPAPASRNAGDFPGLRGVWSWNSRAFSAPRAQPQTPAGQPQLRLAQASDPLHFAPRRDRRLSSDRRLTFAVLPDAAQ